MQSDEHTDLIGYASPTRMAETLETLGVPAGFELTKISPIAYPRRIIPLNPDGFIKSEASDFLSCQVPDRREIA